MLSLEYHARNWALSLFTLPLTNFRRLLIEHGFFPDFVNDIHFPVICLTLHFLIGYVLFLYRESFRRQREEQVAAEYCGNVIAAELDKVVEENGVIKEPEQRNGNAKAAQGRQGRKRYVRGGNGKPREVQSKKKSEQNVNPRQIKLGCTTQDIEKARKGLVKKRLLSPATEDLIDALYKYNSVLYYVCLALLVTRTEPMPGFGTSAESYIRSVGRVLITFTVLGTLEPFRLGRWDIELCGPWMFSNCCMLCNEGPGFFVSALMGFYGLVIMGTIIEVCLYMALRYWPWWPGVWFMDGLTHTEVFIRIDLLVPLIDIAETAIYVIVSKTHPEWYQKRKQTMQRPL